MCNACTYKCMIQGKYYSALHFLPPLFALSLIMFALHVVYLKVVKLFVGNSAFIKYYVYQYCWWFWLPHTCKFHYLDCLSHLKI